jgi:hypothetical protein
LRRKFSPEHIGSFISETDEGPRTQTGFSCDTEELAEGKAFFNSTKHLSCELAQRAALILNDPNLACS